MSQSEEKIHITNIDEFLAIKLANETERPIKLAFKKNGDQGFIKALLLKSSEKMEEECLDFELSPDESLDPGSIEINDILKKTVFTSSAYELFDFILMNFGAFDCLVDFNENAWQVMILRIGKS